MRKSFSVPASRISAMKRNPYESPTAVQPRVEHLPPFPRWVLWLIPVFLLFGLFASCAGGFIVRERAIGRAVQQMREADKGWDEDDLDDAPRDRANRRGLVAFAVFSLASILGTLMGAFAFWRYVLPILPKSKKSPAVAAKS